MRLLIGLFIATLFISCSQKEEGLSGRWAVKTAYYTAQYEIVETEDGYNCRVLSYDDGTHKYKQGDACPRYLFKNIALSSGTRQTDGNTGPTKTHKKHQDFELNLLSKNSLEVTTLISGKKRVEIWKRIKP